LCVRVRAVTGDEGPQPGGHGGALRQVRQWASCLAVLALFGLFVW
jgi:hypothetical protein